MPGTARRSTDAASENGRGPDGPARARTASNEKSADKPKEEILEIPCIRGPNIDPKTPKAGTRKERSVVWSLGGHSQEGHVTLFGRWIGALVLSA